MKILSYLKHTLTAAAVAVMLLPSLAVQAAVTPSVQANAYILYEPDRDMILHAQNETTRIYPASMTKILTAVVMEQYIKPTDIVVAGNEIYNIPLDSSKAGHELGEVLTGENLLRGLIIPSGNETACIVALEVARRVSGDEDISYANAEKLFCGLMNDYAKAIGAKDTHFVNPHGYHADTHYTTAYDLALIVREAMKSDLIRKIALETEYNGPSAPQNAEGTRKIVDHVWRSHNEMIINGVYYYQHATGLKTGFTNEAGECLAATAEREDGSRLIAIVCNSPADIRWADARQLFEYGFTQFSEYTIQTEGQLIGKLEIAKPRLGDQTTLEYFAVQELRAFLNESQVPNIVCDVTIDKAFLAVNEPDPETGEISDEQFIKAPLEKGTVIGSVAYSLNGETLFTDTLIAGRDVLERTFNTDMDHYVAKVKSTVFSVKAIPHWIGAIVAVILIIVLIVMLVKRGRRNRSGKYHFRGRRW